MKKLKPFKINSSSTYNERCILQQLWKIWASVLYLQDPDHEYRDYRVSDRE